MPLRDYRVHRYVNAFCPLCHEERPDRPLAEVRRLSGWLAVRDDRVWLERGCPDHGLVRTLYDESPEILAYLEQWTAPTKVHEPDLAGNFKPVPSAYEDGLPGDADPAHLHPARGHPRPLQPALPDVLRRVLAGPRRGGAARGGAGLDRRTAVPGERPDRRADALRRGADAVPLAGRAARRRGGPARGADPGQHQRAAHRPGRRSCSRCSNATGSASRSTCSTTAPRPRRRRTIAARTSGGSRSGPSSGSPGPASSPR